MSDALRLDPDRLRPTPSAHRLGRSVLLPALTLLSFAAPALADMRMEGRFQGRGEGKLELQVLSMADSGSEGGDAGFFVDATTSVLNSCTGILRGIAATAGPRTLRLRRKPSGSEDICELTLHFSPDYVRVEMGAQSCSDFHGAECDFVGTLRRR